MSITLVQGTASNVLVGLGNAYFGTVEVLPAQTSANHIGFTEDGVSFEYAPEDVEIEVAEENFPVLDITEKESLKAMLTLAEATMANLGKAISAADVSVPSQISLGLASITYISLLIEGNAPGSTGLTRQVFLPKVKNKATVSLSLKKTEKQMYSVEFHARKPTTGRAVVIVDFKDVTIATGTFALTSGVDSYRVALEGGASDSLDTVSGGSTNSDLIVRGKSVSSSATLTIPNNTTSSDAFELSSGSNFILTDERDWIHFQHDGTSWIEQARFDASA